MRNAEFVHNSEYIFKLSHILVSVIIEFYTLTNSNFTVNKK